MRSEVQGDHKDEDVRMWQKPRDCGEMSVRNGLPTEMKQKKKAGWERAVGKFWGRVLKKTWENMSRDQTRRFP